MAPHLYPSRPTKRPTQPSNPTHIPHNHGETSSPTRRCPPYIIHKQTAAPHRRRRARNPWWHAAGAEAAEDDDDGGGLHGVTVVRIFFFRAHTQFLPYLIHTYLVFPHVHLQLLHSVTRDELSQPYKSAQSIAHLDIQGLVILPPYITKMIMRVGLMERDLGR